MISRCRNCASGALGQRSAARFGDPEDMCEAVMGAGAARQGLDGRADEFGLAVSQAFGEPPNQALYARVQQYGCGHSPPNPYSKDCATLPNRVLLSLG